MAGKFDAIGLFVAVGLGRFNPFGIISRSGITLYAIGTKYTACLFAAWLCGDLVGTLDTVRCFGWH